MKYIIYTIAIILLVGVNLGLFNNIQFFGQIPNLVLLFTLCASLEKKNHDYFFVAFVSGVFLDFYSASFFGSFTLSLLLLALSIQGLTNIVAVIELNWKSLSVLLLSALALVDLFSWGYGFIAFKFHWTPDFINFPLFTRSFLATFVYNFVLLFPVFLFYNIVRKIIDNLSLRRTRVNL